MKLTHGRKPHLHLWTTLKGVVGMLRDPHHTESVFDIEDGLRHIEATDLMARKVLADPAVRALIESRWLAGPTDVDALQALPTGSLGRGYAEHITRHGFDADYFRKQPVDSDAAYVQMRMRQTHDIWHVVTGFGVGALGELGLKAFELAQTGRPMAAVLCTGGVVRYLLKDPEQLESMLDYLAYGYHLGTRARPLLAERWEEAWDRPLDEWRERIGWIAPEDTPYRLAHDPDRAQFE